MVHVLVAALLIANSAGQAASSPTETALSFYRSLKQKQYAEGFRRSVYRDALKGLSAAELRDLEPEFARTFAEIPDKIEARGEQITGDTATVFLKFDGVELLQQVILTRIGGEWLVGDKESLQLVRAQGRNFFFNTRIAVNEGEAYETLTRIIGAQVLYAQRFEGKFASLEELVRLGAVAKELEAGELNGYRFAVSLSADQKSYFVTATPVAYGRTGKLSFYADANGIRADNIKGKPASDKTPLYRPM